MKSEANALRHRRAMLKAFAGYAAIAVTLRNADAQPRRALVQVWKDPSCNCCQDWVTHLEQNGFDVRVMASDRAGIEARPGVLQQYASCHTGLVDGYAIEGHVPARDIQRLLRARPAAVGLAVPGMPVGSPGMDGAVYGGRRDPYDVLLILKDGSSRIFKKYS
ncbi:MAG TPA: DUF411 domain-containing protein [Rhodanobacter sp.]